MLKTASLLALLVLGDVPSAQVRSVPLTLGETKLEALVHEKAGSKLVLVNVHDDENTCVEAALNVLEVQGGRLIELKHTGERLITFELGKAKYVVDPNRIFTTVGVTKTLAKNSHGSPEAQTK